MVVVMVVKKQVAGLQAEAVAPNLEPETAVAPNLEPEAAVAPNLEPEAEMLTILLLHFQAQKCEGKILLHVRSKHPKRTAPLAGAGGTSYVCLR